MLITMITSPASSLCVLSVRVHGYWPFHCLARSSLDTTVQIYMRVTRVTWNKVDLFLRCFHVLINAENDAPYRKEISHKQMRLLLRKDDKLIQRLLPHVLQKSSQRIENSLTTMTRVVSIVSLHYQLSRVSFISARLSASHALKYTTSFVISWGRALLTDFASAAPSTVFFVSSALDRGDPASSKLSASSGFVVSLCFTILGDQASSADIASTVAIALFVSLVLNRGGPASCEVFASSVSVVTLCFACCSGSSVPVICFGSRRPSSTRRHYEFGFCRDHILRDRGRSNFTHTLCSCWSNGTDRACCSRPRRSSFFFVHKLCDCESCRGPVLRKSWRPIFSNNLYNYCDVGTVPDICSGPRRAIFFMGHSDFGVGRGTLLCDSRRPRIVSRPCGCCKSGTGSALSSGQCRPSSTRGHCDIRFCRGTVLRNSGRSSFIVTNRLCDCCTWPWHCTLHHHEAHSQFARRSPVAIVYSGPAKLVNSLFPKLSCIHNLFGGKLSHSLTQDQRHRLDCSSRGWGTSPAPPSGYAESPATPFETTLVSGVSFPTSGSSLHTSSWKKRQSLAMRCTLALFLDGRSNAIPSLQMERCLLAWKSVAGALFGMLWCVCVLLVVVLCCLLFVVCCLLFVVCCLLFVVCCLLFVVCCLLFVVCCMLYVVCCLLFVVCCLLFVVCCLLFVVCCLLFVVCCLLFVVCCLLFVVCCLLFVVCCLLFVVCCLLFVVCCLLFVVCVCCLLFVVCCLLFVVCCLLFVVCCLLFVVCCLLFVVCCLLFVVCCLLLMVCVVCCCLWLFVVVIVLLLLLFRMSLVVWCCCMSVVELWIVVFAKLVVSVLSSMRWLLYGEQKRDVTSMTNPKNDICNRT